MRLSEVKVHLCPPNSGRLKAFCSITFDDAIVIRDVKLIDGDNGLFIAMPSRKLCDHCARCHEKNHLRARFCNHCGMRLNENRHQRYRLGPDRLKLHADIAHPINVSARSEIEREVFAAYERELVRSREPGYVPTPMETDVPELPMALKTGAA
jgi:stage V sporulation protein G